MMRSLRVVSAPCNLRLPRARGTAAYRKLPGRPVSLYTWEQHIKAAFNRALCVYGWEGQTLVANTVWHTNFRVLTLRFRKIPNVSLAFDGLLRAFFH